MYPRELLALVACVLVSTATVAGGGGGGFAGATEVTQIANNTELVMSYVEQAQQTVHQFNQYQAMLKNLQQLNPSALLSGGAQRLWQDQRMNDTFRNLYRITTGGQRIAYSLQSLDRQMRSLNPDYSSVANVDFQAAYRNWFEATRGASMAALELSSAHAEDLQSEADVMRELVDMSQTADGQLKAITAGNRIGISMVSQMQKLRQLQMAQVNAQETVRQAEQGRRDAGDALMLKALQRAKGYSKPRSQGTDLFKGIQ